MLRWDESKNYSVVRFCQTLVFSLFYHSLAFLFPPSSVFFPPFLFLCPWPADAAQVPILTSVDGHALGR